MNRITRVATGAAVVVGLALPIGWTVVPALAGTNDTTTTTAPTATTTTAPAGPAAGSGSATAVRGRRAAILRRLRGRAGARLATKLGISDADLRAAVATARQHPPATPITDPAQRRSYWEGQLADALHIDVATLRAAELGVYTDSVNARVAAGRLTRSQGDQLIAAFAAGDLKAVRQQLGLARGGK